MFRKIRTEHIIVGGALAVVLICLGIAARPSQLQAFQSPLPTPESQTSQPLYFQSPLPTPMPTPFPTISPNLPNSERALLFIAQRKQVPQDRLLLADAFTIGFPLTHRSLWQGLVLDSQDGTPVLYEVLIDGDTKEILTEGLTNPEAYWATEEIAFREHYADQILSLVSRREGVPVSSLDIAAGIMEYYALTGQIVWRGKIQDSVRGDIYEVAVNAQGQSVNVEALEAAENTARRSRYGKMELPLYYYLRTRPPQEKSRVLLWVGGVDYEWVNEELARRYPQVQAYRFASGQPVDERGQPIPIERELFDRIRRDYNDLLDQAHLQAAEPVAAFLRARGYEANALSAFPGIEVELPAKVILELNRASLENLVAIYHRGSSEVVPELDSVGGTIRASAAWNSGYTGQGVRIGMIDGGVVNPNVTHRALQGKVVAADSNNPTDWHAALVAGVMIGDHPNFPQYRGIAYGSDELVSAGGGVGPGSINFLVDRDAFVINASISTTSTRVMQWEDRVFDYLVRLRDPTIAVAAGAGGGNVKSPGKAYNVITVGAFDDHNDPHWNDTMWDDSARIDPYIDGQTTSGDREKPEVVAVGVDVTTVDINQGDDGFDSFDGTSVATPQVSALAALLIQRYWFIRTNPEAVKAIIMASATHNIEGDARLSEADGAGAIDVASALAVFHSGGWGYKIIHNITDPNDPSNPFDGYGSSYDFRGSDFVVGSTHAYAGERIRAVICWDSNPANDYSTDPLSTDLDLLIISPNGSTVASSTSWHNNYEIVDFVAPEAGEYRMRVKYYARTPAEGLDLGLGLAWLRIHRVYLPLVMKNH